MGKLVYIDLYAGSGFSKVAHSGDILLGSPLIALSTDRLFDEYIFCEADTAKLQALRARAARLFPNANVTCIQGDCFDRLDEIARSIPSSALCLCVVDPYDLSLKFETLRRLSQGRKMDFLCLIASHMDGSRNHAIYSSEKSTKLDEFLGSSGWRVTWKDPEVSRGNFGQFITKEFATSMEGLGYFPTPLHKMKEIRTDDTNVPLYHLALFAKHELAHRYWKEVLKYSTPQKGLFD